MNKVFMVEDDAQIVTSVSRALAKWDYQVVTVTDWHQVTKEILQQAPQLVLLDITLPTFDGFYWLQKLRKHSKVPVIVISAAEINDNVMHAVAAGADDYIMKPFANSVLIAKIQAVIRRANYQQVSRVSAWQGFRLNELTNQLSKDSKIVQLTPTEGAMMAIMLAKHGRIVSKQELLELLWQGGKFLNENTLNVNISRLRAKLAKINLADKLVTERGVGYRLVKDDD